MQQPQLPANQYTQRVFKKGNSSLGWRLRISLPTISTGKGIWRMKMNTKHTEALPTHTLFCLQTPKDSQRESTNQLNAVTEKFVPYPARLKLDVDKNVLGGRV